MLLEGGEDGGAHLSRLDRVLGTRLRCNSALPETNITRVTTREAGEQCHRTVVKS